MKTHEDRLHRLKNYLAALLICVASTATADLLPSLYRVVPLEAGDTLNVRNAPSASAADIGDLASGQQIEVIGTNDDGSWGQIVWQEGNGWVATRFLEDVPRPQLETGFPTGLACFGNEPFWSLDLNTNGTTILATPENKTEANIIWSSKSANVAHGRYAFTTSGTSGVLQRAACTDGMSDRTYGWSLDLILTTKTPRLLSGCCLGR